MSQASMASKWAGKFWGYSTNFKPEPIACDFLSAFPGLAKAFADGVFQGETAELVASLRLVPFGWAFVTRGPTSGKTTAVMAIAKAITSQVANPSVPQDPPFDEEKVNDKRYDDDGSSVSDDDEYYIRPESGYSLPVTEQNTQQEDAANDKWDAGSSSPDSESHVVNVAEPTDNLDPVDIAVSDSESETSAATADAWSARIPPPWDQTTANTADAWNQTPANHVDELTRANRVAMNATPNLAQRSHLEQEEQYEPLGSEFDDSDSDGEPFVRSPGWTQHTPNIQGAGRVQTARVAWAALQNKLADDATRRAKFACPDKVVVRVLPWKVELINLRRVEDTTPKMTDLTTVPRVSPASRAMVMHTNSVRMNSFRNKSPASVFGSLSEFARSMVEKDLETWELM
ncbi:CCHC-type domain-containing protein [Fusarium sp. LHS14.1]|nr:CCHC-type domain-containing protein [Fusarium sp. LHS14.1]